MGHGGLARIRTQHAPQAAGAHERRISALPQDARPIRRSRCRLLRAFLAAAQPHATDDLLQCALGHDETHCGPGGAAARQRAVDNVGSARAALKAAGTRATPELSRIADTPLDALAYAQVVVLLFVLCQAAEDLGRVASEWEDAVLADLNDTDEPVRTHETAPPPQELRLARCTLADVGAAARHANVRAARHRRSVGVQAG